MSKFEKKPIGSGPSTSRTGAAGPGRSGTSTAASGGNNPIKGLMLDEDDEFLTGLAPPKKDAGGVTKSMPGDDIFGGGSSAFGGKGNPPGKSVDNIFNMFKDDEIKLPAGKDDDLDLFGTSSK